MGSLRTFQGKKSRTTKSKSNVALSAPKNPKAQRAGRERDERTEADVAIPQFRRVRRTGLSDNRRASYRCNDVRPPPPFGRRPQGSRVVDAVRRNTHSM